MTLSAAAIAGMAGVSAWASRAAETGHAHHAGWPHGAPGGVRAPMLTGAEAEARRWDALSRASFRLPPPLSGATPAPSALHTSDALEACRYLATPPSGTSAKFECLLGDGTVVKVKYGRNPEIHAEAAAARLMRLLGYPTDDVSIVPRLRCYGCPRHPFLAMRLRARFGLQPPGPDADGYSDFEWAAVERRFPAPEIRTERHDGWAWWELGRSHARRRHVDALRLTAVFLAHWDNKAENQRLVCLDGLDGESTWTPANRCERPLAMIHDLGATFGPAKVNLARWRERPVWHDRAACIVSMRAMPFGGGSFPDVRIAESARADLARRLAAIGDDELERIFAAARFPDFQVATDDAGDLEAWVAAFRHRARQIAEAGPCPDLSPDAGGDGASGVAPGS
jgi:hypothetical protein